MLDNFYSGKSALNNNDEGEREIDVDQVNKPPNKLKTKPEETLSHSSFSTPKNKQKCSTIIDHVRRGEENLPGQAERARPV